MTEETKTSPRALELAAQAWCKSETERLVMNERMAVGVAQVIQPLLDELEMAWVIMSNSSNWDDGRGSPGWKDAAMKWRERYFKIAGGAGQPEEAETPEPEKEYFLWAQEWEESERGWGYRPDGLSLHVDKDARNRYVTTYLKRQKSYFEEQGIKGTPDEYTRTSGEPKMRQVSRELYEAAVEGEGCEDGFSTPWKSLSAAGDLKAFKGFDD